MSQMGHVVCHPTKHAQLIFNYKFCPRIPQMSESPAITLYYVHDPMCSWCWGFSPVWNQIKQELPQQIKLISWVGGLAPDSDEAMPQSMRDHLQATWKRISDVIPGTQFNFDFWTLNTPRRSTYPACRAVIVARQMADKEDEMTLAIQHAYYLEAKNPSDLETLNEVAVSIGLDLEQFRQRMFSTELLQDFESELQSVRNIGVNSFPSLVLESGASRFNIPINYTSAEVVLQDIQRLLNSWKKGQ
jgi:putative protein-disulfide isomerase